MRAWIEYLTSKGQDRLTNERRANGRAEPFKVSFIGIDNESWGYGGSARCFIRTASISTMIMTIAPRAFDGGRITDGMLRLDVPAKSVVVLTLH